MAPTKGELLQAVLLALPQSQHISAWDLDSEKEALRFNWDGTRYRVTVDGSVDEVDGKMLAGGTVSRLMAKVIQRELQDMAARRMPAERAPRVPRVPPDTSGTGIKGG